MIVDLIDRLHNVDAKLLVVSDTTDVPQDSVTQPPSITFMVLFTSMRLSRE